MNLKHDHANRFWDVGLLGTTGYRVLLVAAIITILLTGCGTPAHQGVIGEELIVGDTRVKVTEALVLDKLELGNGWSFTPESPDLLFLQLSIDVTNLKNQHAELEGEEGKDSIFTLICNKGKEHPSMGRLVNRKIYGNQTRTVGKTYSIEKNLLEGAKLRVKDIFSNQEVIILLEPLTRKAETD